MVNTQNRDSYKDRFRLREIEYKIEIRSLCLPRFHRRQTRNLGVSTLMDIIRRFLLHYMALIRERTLPTERPPLVDEVSVNFCG
jgi:hypothetical protein